MEEEFWEFHNFDDFFVELLIGNVCVSSASDLVLYLYRGVVVNKYGINKPLTMTLNVLYPKIFPLIYQEFTHKIFFGSRLH